MTSIHEEHMKWVQKLMDRGETVLQPEYGEPMGNIQGYIKTQLPHKDAGAIFQDKDGAFGLFGDMGALHVTGLDWDNLGLCDSRCWYEWMSPETYQPKTGKPEDQKKENIKHLVNMMQESFKLTEEIGKRANELDGLYNAYLAKLRARTVYLEEDVVAGLHNEGLESGNWELFVNRVLREALQTLADKQER